MRQEDIFGKQKGPQYKGQTIYRDVADNLSKIKFPVVVTEGYNPNVHWSLLREGAPPPIFDPGPDLIDAECEALLSGDFIIDALVSGQQLRFRDPNDMDILASWIEQYIASYKGIDLTRFPDRLSFLENAKKALGMMRSNLVRKTNWMREVNPAPLSLAEIIANM